MKILIADDHSIIRKGVSNFLEKEFKEINICEVTNGADAIDKAKSEKWDLILMDISMPGMNGIDALKQIRLYGINTPVLMLSMQQEDQYAIRVLKAGASGYISKDCTSEQLIGAVHKVLNGRKYMSPEVSEQLAISVTESNGKMGHELLSDREMQVVILLASGKSLTQIASEIYLSSNTISTYRARILEKLQLKSTSAIIRYAIDNHLV